MIQALQSPTGLASDGFGQRVALSDRHLAVLAPLTAPNGSVFVYRRTDDPALSWALEQEITIEAAFPGMLQNAKLALEENTLVVGVPNDSQLGFIAGAAYVFQRGFEDVSPWRLVQTLLAPDGKHGDTFGFSLDLQGERLAVGAPAESSIATWNGAVYCFERRPDAPDTWEFRQKLAPRSLEIVAGFGGVLDIDGSTLAVGAPKSNFGAIHGGAVYLFETGERGWVESHLLTAPDVAFQDSFGGGVAVSGDWLIVASALDDEVGKDSGAVHLFQRKTGLWTHYQKVLPEMGEENDNFGGFLAAGHDTFYVGNPFVSEVGVNAGTVYTFALDHDSGHWIQTSRFFPPDLDDHDHLGPVAARDGIVAAGAGKSMELGTVYVYSVRAGRDVVRYCTATSGADADCAPALETLGAPSASQGSTFRLWSRTVPGARSGVLLYSEGGLARPDLTSSGVCIPTANFHRKGLFWSGGTFGACDGSFDLDWNDFIDDRARADSLLRTPGATVHVQIAWFDPLVPSELAWSDAVAFQLCP